jgi:hypothetical protein
MQAVTNKIRPKLGFAPILHIGLNVLLPLIVLILVRNQFAEIGLVVILVRPRYWLANIRSNGIDIMVGISSLIFMTHTSSFAWQIVWTAVYIGWLVYLKPASNTLSVCVQAFIGQLMGLMAVFVWLNSAPLYQLIIASWIVCYLAARHFFIIFEEPFNSLYAHTWGYFGGALSWVLGHWLLFYGTVAQPTVILSVLGFGIGSLYYINHIDKLNKLLRRQIVLIMIAIVLVILVFSNWSSKIV